MKRVILLVFVAAYAATMSSAQNRWTMCDDGSIVWNVQEKDVHTDHIEMSGKQVSVILTYGIDPSGQTVSNKRLVFPMLRTIPNNTGGNVICSFGEDTRPVIRVNNRVVKERPLEFRIKGMVTMTSELGYGITLQSTIFSSTEKPAVIEKFAVTNTSDKAASVDIGKFDMRRMTHKEKSVYDVYELSAKTFGDGVYSLQPGESAGFYILYSGKYLSGPDVVVNTDDELTARAKFIDKMFHDLQFVSPDPVLNRMFAFAKIRAIESIYKTKNGLVHSPGGGAYYAAIWANDQAEYANPFFAYSGCNAATESALTSWRWFAGYMNPEYEPIPSSIIAEGTGYWNGAGDRGDMAMIAYGAARFALALGDKEKAFEVWPLIEWCLEYCRRKINDDGVVASDSDELENRFPAGEANLCTSSLYYDALVSSAYLGKELGIPSKQVKEYEKRAKDIRTNINRYFGANVQGFNTYRYYDGNDILRSWICIPLTVGIFDRKAGTIDALFSPMLWTENGLLTQQNSRTFWDRSTLYGLRGAFAAGAVDKSLGFLTDYSTKRLLGDHVPYAVEAWPEGNQRHLSAESALYCRVITEGLFGFRPTGLRSFELTPQLPGGWGNMELKNIIAFGTALEISVNRVNDKVNIAVRAKNKPVISLNCNNGETVNINIL